MQTALRTNQTLAVGPSKHARVACSTPGTRPTQFAAVRTGRSRVAGVSVRAFKLDLRKVQDVLARATDAAWDDRLETLKRFYSDLRRSTAEELLAPDFAMYEAGHEKKFSRDDYMQLLYECVLPAIPDFKWGSATSNEIDSDGYVLVTVQASGHHSGKPFVLPGLPAVPASGRHFCLEEEAQMVLVKNGKVKDIKVFPVRGAGPMALYTALGGELPAPKARALASEEHLPLP